MPGLASRLISKLELGHATVGGACATLFKDGILSDLRHLSIQMSPVSASAQTYTKARNPVHGVSGSLLVYRSSAERISSRSARGCLLLDAFVYRGR